MKNKLESFQDFAKTCFKESVLVLRYERISGANAWYTVMGNKDVYKLIGLFINQAEPLLHSKCNQEGCPS